MINCLGGWRGADEEAKRAVKICKWVKRSPRCDAADTAARETYGERRRVRTCVAQCD